MYGRKSPLSKSASRVMDILDYISRAGKAVTISEISSKLRIPKSSVFNLLHTMVSRRYLEFEDEKLKTVRLGFRLFQTGVAYLQNVKLHQIAHPMLKELMEESGETVFLGVEDEGRLVFLDSVETSTSIRTAARLGRTDKPMYCSGLGKALLASYSDEKVRRIVSPDGFIPVSKNTVKSFEELFLELGRTRKRGYAVDNREAGDDLICVAAPVYDQSDRAVAAISIAAPFFKMNGERKVRLAGLVTKTALEVSRKLGFLGDRFYQKIPG